MRRSRQDHAARADVLIAAHSGNLEYGGERSLLELARHLKSQGIKPHVVVSHRGTFTAALEEEDIPFSIVWMRWWVRASEGPPIPFRFRRANPRRNAVVELVDLIRFLDPKLCLTNTITMPWLAYAAAMTGTRHVWFVHESGVSDFGMEFAIGVGGTRSSISALSDGVFFNSLTTAREYSGDILPAKAKGVIYPVGDVTLLPKRVEDPFGAGSFRVGS